MGKEGREMFERKFFVRKKSYRGIVHWWLWQETGEIVRAKTERHVGKTEGALTVDCR
jgi:hypothetical protein